MAAPLLLAANFLRAIQALLPRGQVWPRDQDAVQTKALAGLAHTYERNTARANYLLVDAFPGTTYELLPEWEATLGLPDPCAGSSPTLQQRQSQVAAYVSNNGGQSIAYFVEYAKRLGYDIGISQYTPFRMGQQTMGCQLGSPDWAFTWAVNAPLVAQISFRMGMSAMGEPLETWGNAVLECELSRLKPAHTIALFRYLTEITSSTVITATGSPVITARGAVVSANLP